MDELLELWHRGHSVGQIFKALERTKPPKRNKTRDAKCISRGVPLLQRVFTRENVMEKIKRTIPLEAGQKRRPYDRPDKILTPGQRSQQK